METYNRIGVLIQKWVVFSVSLYFLLLQFVLTFFCPDWSFAEYLTYFAYFMSWIATHVPKVKTTLFSRVIRSPLDFSLLYSFRVYFVIFSTRFECILESSPLVSSVFSDRFLRFCYIPSRNCLQT